MRQIFILVILNFFKLAILASQHDISGPEICETVVTTANGLVRGKYFKGATGKEVCAFLGIPYAKPPVGELRFRRPQPVESWEGIYEANEFPSTCTQTAWGPKKFVRWDHNISEDCLGLNIWVPVSALQNKGTRDGAVVMVWIHEGGFSVGSSTKPGQDGAVLAGEKDVIVASMQYRLGPLGFLYFGFDEAPGNMGLLDQNLALKWINTNIAGFGGNKNEITLFGESAGSLSTSFHMLSPLSQGLFKRGIMMSGTGSSSLCVGSKAEAMNLSYEVAESVGCWSPQDRDDLNKRPEEGVAPAKWLGTYHTADIDYIFGIPLQSSRLNEKNLSKKMQDLFTNFARTGVPSKNWLPYTTSQPVFLDLNATVISDTTPSDIFGPHADDCAFWNEEFPRLREAFEVCHTENHSKITVEDQSCPRTF